MVLGATLSKMLVVDKIVAVVLTLWAAIAERAQKRKERIKKLKETKALLKDVASKCKLFAQCYGRAQERKRLEREKLTMAAYFRRSRDPTSSSEGFELPWGTKDFVILGSLPGTAINVLSSDIGGNSSSGSSGSVADPNPEHLLVTDDDLLGAEIHGDEF
jgi:hypothetical protein